MSYAMYRREICVIRNVKAERCSLKIQNLFASHYHAPAVLCEQYITRTSLQVIINASVPELQAREWCMGDVHANFNSFSRFRLLRPPYPSPVPEFFCNHKKWMAGSLKHMTEIVHWISSRKMN
jgi:hypothetical protein